VHSGAGLAAFLMGEPRQAQQELEEALRLAPELTEASTLLGEVLYRGNDLTGAIRVYEEAAVYAPGHQPLIARLEE
jgi:tetratricopeptide (TPR) repeat protein